MSMRGGEKGIAMCQNPIPAPVTPVLGVPRVYPLCARVPDRFRVQVGRFPLPLTTMARTRQTARKTTGGRVPRKEVVRRDQRMVESNASSSVAIRRAPVHQVSTSDQFVSVAYPMTTGFLLCMH